MIMKTFLENVHFSTVLAVSNIFWQNADNSLIIRS